MIIDSPVISGSLQSSGSLVQVGNTVISGSLVVTSGITGSFQGTSSFASSASYSVSSSYAVSASAAVNAETLDGLDSTVFVLTGSFNSTSASLADRTTKLESTASYLNNASASLNDKVTSLESTASILTSASASLSTASGSLNAGLVNVIQTTASFATTGSNVFTGKQQVSDVTNPISFTSTASLYVDGGMRVTRDAYISGTLYLNNLTVYGTSSIQYITSSQLNIGANLITLNTDVPTIRFGGLSVYDSGSTKLSGSLLWDSENNHWIYSNPSGSEYDGGMLLSGPKNSSGLGNEQGINCNAIIKGQGGDHLTSSAIYEYGNATCFYGGASTIAANTIATLQISATGVTASLEGTASVAVSSSQAANAVSSSYALTASFATTASYALNAGAGAGFPYSGSAVITGSLQITNLTGSGVRYLVADESGSITAQTASAVIKTTQAYTATAGQTVFAVSGGYSTGYVDVFINGSKLNSSEFTDTSGTNIVLTTGSFLDDVVEVVKYLPASGVSNNVLRQLTTFTASAGQTSFTVDYTPGLLDVFYNGARLTPVEYTANNGTSITLATASLQGDVLDIMVYSYQVGAFSGIGGQGVANQVSYYSTTNSITGSNTLTFDGSTMRVTGSLLVTGSGTFTNIGPAVFSGSVVVTGSIVVSGSIISTGGITISGSIASASYALSASNADLLDGLDSTVFTLTSSFNEASASLDAGLKNVIARTGSFATTGSNVFYGNQTVSASMFVSGSVTATGQIVAQTINVQSVTSSIVYSSGSNVFGNDISNTQTFTGSMLITGSVRATGNICTTGTVCAAVVCSPIYLGGTVSGTTIYGSTAICGGVICGGATTLTGALSGTSATFSSGGNTNVLISNDSVDTGYNIVSLNGTRTKGSYAGIAGGGTGDNNLYLNSGASVIIQTGASYTARLTISSTGAATFACSITGNQITSNYVPGSLPAMFRLCDGNGGTDAKWWMIETRSTSGNDKWYAVTSLNDEQNAISYGMRIHATNNDVDQVLFPNGFIGINESSPSTYGRLTINTGASNNTVPLFTLGYGTTLSNLVLRNTYPRANGILNGIEFRDSSNEVQASIYACATGANNQSVLIFGTNNGTGGNGLTGASERMRITNSGQIAIGNNISTSTEANLFLGAQGTVEGGQLVLQKGTSCSCATHLDNYNDSFRVLVGSDTTSTGVHFLVDHKTRAACFYGALYVPETFIQGPTISYAAQLNPAGPAYTQDLQLVICHSNWGGNDDTGTVYVEYTARAYAVSQTTAAYGVMTYRLNNGGTQIGSFGTGGVTTSNVTISGDVATSRVLKITFSVTQNVDRITVFARTTNPFVTAVTGNLV